MLRELPAGWSVIRLGEILSLQYGKSLPERSRTAGKVPVFGSSGVVGHHSEALVNGPGIIVGRKGTVGSVTLSEVDFWPIDTTYYVLPKDASDLRWLKYLLDHLDLARLNEATGVPGLNRDKAEGAPVLVPPPDEQRRIAEILSSVDEAIQATQAVIEQTRKVKQGVLKRLLTKGIGHTGFKQTEIGEMPEAWGLGRLSELSCLVTSGSRGWAQHYTDEGDLFVRSQNIRDGVLNLADRQHVRVPTNAEGARTLVHTNDLLFTITGNGVGNIAKVPSGLGTAYVSQHIGLVRLNEPHLADLFVAFFSPSGPGNVQITGSQYGQSKPGLSLENIRQFVAPIPPAAEARRIIEMIREFTAAEMSAIEHRSHLSALKSAVMSDLLTGRKRVSADLLMAAE